MALVDHYVTTTGSDTYANSTNSSTPCSLSTALTAMSSGGTAAPTDRIWIKAGAYAQRGATDTLTIDGTIASPIVIAGYNSTIGDLDTPTYNADGSLVTTNYPVIDYAQTFRLNAVGADYVIWRNVKITSAGTGNSGGTLVVGINCVVHQCYLSNPSTNAAAACLTLNTAAIVENNDFALTGASGGLAAVGGAVSGIRVIGNRFLDSQAAGMTFSGTGQATILDNVFFAAVTVVCIDITGTNTAMSWTIRGNTIQGKTTAIRCAAATYTPISYYGDNHLTDNTTAILSLQDGTSQLAGWFSHNRFRDNTANVDGWDDWKSGGTAGEVTIDTGGTGTDYTAAASDQYRLISGAPGVGTASVANRDIGAMQRSASAAGGVSANLSGGIHQ